VREKALLERIKSRYPISVAAAVGSLQKNLGLDERQRAKLVDLLVRETRPPRSFGDASDIAVLLFQASRIPTEKIKPIFDEAQWRTMTRWMAAYKIGAGGEAVLKRHGFVSDDVSAGQRFKPSEPPSDKERPKVRIGVR
jgi:hypothetical protein